MFRYEQGVRGAPNIYQVPHFCECIVNNLKSQQYHQRAQRVNDRNTLYVVHYTSYAVHRTLYDVLVYLQCTSYTVHPVLYLCMIARRFTVFQVHSYAVHYMQCIRRRTLYDVQSTEYTYTLYNVQYILYTGVYSASCIR